MEKILIMNSINKEGVNILKKNFNVIEGDKLNFKNLKYEISTSDAIITRSDTSIDKKFLRAAKNVKIIARAGIGVDNIDKKTAGALGILVVNAPFGNALAAAEHTISLMFSLARMIPQADYFLKKGFWGKHKFKGVQLNGKTLGIIGFGRVGRKVAKMALGIGMKIIYCDPFVKNGKSFANSVFFEELLRRSDVITIHTSLTKLTNNLIGKNELSLLKKNALLINCARGGIVNEKDLYFALKNKKFYGAALDVFEKEPVGKNKLLELENVIATPHLGAATKEAKIKTATEIAKEVTGFLKNKKVKNIVNKIYLKKRKKFLWKKFDKIIFDCDSTLTKIEGIDELARLKNKYRKVEKLTEKAMNGDEKFEKVFEERLKIIKPNRKDLTALGKIYLKNLTNGAMEILEALRFLDIDVYIVSGGYKAPIEFFAKDLFIAKENVFANRIFFDKNGEYKSFDKKNPLCENNGKIKVVKLIKQNKKTVFIGDGIVCYKTSKIVDLFIGFGGVKKRKEIQKLSPVYVKCGSLVPILPIIVGREGCEKLVNNKKYKILLQNGLTRIFCKNEISFGEKYESIKKEIKDYFLEEGV